MCIRDRFYTIFTEEYSQNKLELINNTLTSTDKSVYDLYCYPLNEFTQKKPISSSILFQYHELQKEDFLDSVGAVSYTHLCLRIFFFEIPFVFALVSEEGVSAFFVAYEGDGLSARCV